MPLPLTNEEMEAVFSVTDALGIHREHLFVPLRKQDPGSVRKMGPQLYQIVLPASIPVQEWLPTLRAELERLL